MNLALWLARAAKSHANAPAVAIGGRVARNYAELAERASRLAGALRGKFGLQSGERVAIVAYNCVEYVELLYGIWHAGLAAVPINAKLHGAEIGYILEHSAARVCFASGDIETAISAHAPPTLQHLIAIDEAAYKTLFTSDVIDPMPRQAEDLAWLFYTSGTTGRPKGAVLTHRVLAAASYAYAAEVDPIQPGDALIHGAPMSHGSGLYIMAHIMRLGINVIPETGAFDPEEIFRLWNAWPESSMFAAPTMIKRLVDCPADCSNNNIRSIIWGGAPMYLEDAIQALDRFGPRFTQIYGQGESPMTITTLSKQDIADRDHPRWRDRLSSAGRPFASVEVEVVGSDNKPLRRGEIGEVVCRGDVVMPGYWRNPDATAAALKEGWLHTGDVGCFDIEGYLTLKDRSKDLIISGGSNIYPREVEEILVTHRKVREVSVIGRPDREWGEAVVAYIVGDADPRELDALCLSRIARFKRPKDYIFVAALPKNNYGKVLKVELRMLDAKRQESPRQSSTPTNE
jgi:long-chain acyl-CoA synthetase